MCDFFVGHGGCGIYSPLGLYLYQLLMYVDEFIKSQEYFGFIVGVGIFLILLLLYGSVYYFIISMLNRLFYGNNIKS